MTNKATKKELENWIEKLRSGEYQQTKGTLKEKLDNLTFGYCCLGVFEEAVIGNHIKPEVYDSYNHIPEGDEKTYDRLRDMLSQPVVAHLTTMNDDKGYTFEEIADWIEEKLLPDAE